jgi:D-sedoheptulose 7-phosphate isomerase|tara:strand:+ start:356 stop:949 length:594 start_codon:yes stop_codon:yes gene_type:complete
MNKKFDSKKISRKEIVNYLNQSSEIAEYQLTLIDEIVKVTEVCIETLNNGGKIIFCGNGGSASDSQHLAAELVGRFMKNRKPIPAISINTDTSVLTSISNDFGYNYVFSKQIEALGNEKDTLFLLTTSGKSKNIIEAGNKAKEIGLNVISMSGNNIQELKEFSTMIISIPSNVPGIVQQAHITIGQLICMNIEDSLI